MSRCDITRNCLVPMADSTIEDVLQESKDPCPGPLSIRCVIEHVRDVDNKLSATENCWQVDIDTNVDVPPSLSFLDLPYFVLGHLGYTDTEMIGCKASVELKNWKPIPLDAVTDDNDVSVDHVLGDLLSLLVFHIKLRRMPPCQVLDDMRQKLFSFLVCNATNLSSSCYPTKQRRVNEPTTNGANEHSKLDETETFDEWYDESTARCSGEIAENSTDIPSVGMTKITSPRTSTNGRRSSYGYSRSWFDPVTEIPLLQHWFHENRHPTQADMVEYTRRINAGPNRQPPRRPVSLANIAHWFKISRACCSVTKSESSVGDLLAKSTSSSVTRHISDNERLICGQSNMFETGSSTELSDGEDIPELPNHNAVYVVKPLATAASSDGIAVVEGNGDNFSTVTSQCPELPDPRKAFLNTAADTSRKRHRSWKSDENHNRRRRSSSSSSVTDDDDMATDLSVHPVDSNSNSTAHMERTRQTSFSSTSFDSAVFRLNPCFPISELDVKQESGANTVGDTLHPLLTPAASACYCFPPHLQMQMAMMTQAAMRYMQPIYSAGVPGTPPSVATMRTPTFPLLPSSLPKPSPCDDDSAGSTNGDTSSSADGRRKRTRVFIDPVSEIPQLEQWFRQDSHPSSSAIDRLTDELNRSVYRRRFPKLEPKNVQLWFKNHRAKVKRQSNECSPTSSIVGAGSFSTDPFSMSFSEEKISIG